MNDEEKRLKVIKHNAKRPGYFIKMIISLVAVPGFFSLSINTDGIISVLSMVMRFVSVMVATCFKALHMGMLYCPLCGASFGYGSWFTRTMPYTCPHCNERLNY